MVGWLADRWGPRRVILLSAIILSAGTMLSSRVTALWQVYITSEVLMGLGAGGVGMSTGAALAARWFEARRGLVMGLVGGAMSAGQLVVVPLAVWLTLNYGWRQSFLWLGILMVAVAVPTTWLFVHDDPAQKGVRAYGGGHGVPAAGAPAPHPRAAPRWPRPCRCPRSGCSRPPSSCAATRRTASC